MTVLRKDIANCFATVQDRIYNGIGLMKTHESVFICVALHTEKMTTGTGQYHIATTIIKDRLDNCPSLIYKLSENNDSLLPPDKFIHQSLRKEWLINLINEFNSFGSMPYYEKDMNFIHKIFLVWLKQIFNRKKEYIAIEIKRKLTKFYFKKQ